MERGDWIGCPKFAGNTGHGKREWGGHGASLCTKELFQSRLWASRIIVGEITSNMGFVDWGGGFG